MRKSLSYFSIHNILRNMPQSYYAVAKGRKPGVYHNWDECKAQVHQFSGPIYKKFKSLTEAETFISQHKGSTKQSSEPRLSEPSGKQGSSDNRGPLPSLPSLFISSYNRGTVELRQVSDTRTPRLVSNNAILHTKKQSILQQVLKVSSASKRSISTGSKDDISVQSFKRRKTTADESSSGNNKTSPGSFNIDEKGYVNVYTDGACSSNGQAGARAGIGVWFGDGHPLNISRAVVGRATNNMAEIQAVTVAAEQAKKAGIKKLKINTDSKFLITCITEWMPKWKANGWKTALNKPVINKTELIEMEKALASLDISWNHVNGHVGIYGNEMADKLARAGCSGY